MDKNYVESCHQETEEEDKQNNYLSQQQQASTDVDESSKQPSDTLNKDDVDEDDVDEDKDDVEIVTNKDCATDNSNSSKLEKFLQWIEKSQIKFSNKVKVSLEGTCHRFGLIATDEIKKGQILFVVPRKVVMSSETTEIADMIENHAEWLEDTGKSLDESSGWVPLLITLMYEYLHKNSPWRQYLDLIPETEEFGQPIFWPDEELDEELQGLPIHDDTKQDKANLEDEYKRYVIPFVVRNKDVLCKGLEHYSLDLYRRMVAFIMAYSFTEYNDSPPEMIPVADILNHHSNSNAFLLFGKDVLKMCSSRKIEKGEEIFNTFGKLGNTALLQMYGYIEMPVNNFDALLVNVSLFFDVMEAEEKLNLSTIHAMAAYLHKTGLAMSDDYFIFDKNGLRSGPDFINMLKVLHMSELEFENMLKLRAGNRQNSFYQKLLKKLKLAKKTEMSSGIAVIDITEDDDDDDTDENVSGGKRKSFDTEEIADSPPPKKSCIETTEGACISSAIVIDDDMSDDEDENIFSNIDIHDTIPNIINNKNNEDTNNIAKEISNNDDSVLTSDNSLNNDHNKTSDGTDVTQSNTQGVSTADNLISVNEKTIDNETTDTEVNDNLLESDTVNNEEKSIDSKNDNEIKLNHSNKENNSNHEIVTNDKESNIVLNTVEKVPCIDTVNNDMETDTKTNETKSCENTASEGKETSTDLGNDSRKTSANTVNKENEKYSDTKSNEKEKLISIVNDEKPSDKNNVADQISIVNDEKPSDKSNVADEICSETNITIISNDEHHVNGISLSDDHSMNDESIVDSDDDGDDIEIVSEDIKCSHTYETLKEQLKPEWKELVLSVLASIENSLKIDEDDIVAENLSRNKLNAFHLRKSQRKLMNIFRNGIS